ncbi:hypothetical protein BKA70DRAFT_1435388 [Coprinopsis sp. MPI-PUGE-AT-0042]|nr:hypothetical protein BKA70DRAFT_1435388 [Coprinopsis sp. MPI-PUGE-AT-0042]
MASIHQAPTAAELQADPEMLVKRSPKRSGSLSPLDGTLGAVIDDGHYFITTQNAQFIPLPPLGYCREVWMRADFRYADDDPLQWPQPYNYMHPHLSVLRNPPLHGDPFEYLFISPLNFGVHLISGVIHGLDETFQRMLEYAVSSVQIHVEGYRERVNTPYNDNDNNVFMAANLMSNFLTRIKDFPMTRNELLRSVAELQRYARETMAYIDYYVEVKPCINGIAKRATTVANVIGAFVQDALIAQELQAAGIPFWFVHPVSDVGHVRVEALATLRLPQPTLVFKDAKPKMPIIFKGPATSLRRINEMRIGSRIAMHCGDVFTLAETPADAENFIYRPSASSSVQRNTCVAQLSHPYVTSKLSAGQRHTISTNLPGPPVAGGCAPAIHDVWLKALSSISLSSFPDSLPSDRSYILPDPNSFIEPATKTVRTPLLHRYLKLRPTLIQRLGVATSATPIAIPLPGRIWRQVLVLDQAAITSSLTSTSTSGSQSKAARERFRAAVFLSSCLDATKDMTTTTLDTILSSTPIFRGEEISLEALSNSALAKEVLWELAEVNFRVELGVLNQRLSRDTSHDETQPDVLDCVCPASAPRALLVIDLQQAHQGLASNDPHERLPQLLRLKALFGFWKVPAPHFPTWEVRDASTTKITALESALFDFYVHCYFTSFGRYPIVPRTLT